MTIGSSSLPVAEGPIYRNAWVTPSNDREERSPRVIDHNPPFPALLSPDDIECMATVRNPRSVRSDAIHLPLRQQHRDIARIDGFQVAHPDPGARRKQGPEILSDGTGTAHFFPVTLDKDRVGFIQTCHSLQIPLVQVLSNISWIDSGLAGFLPPCSNTTCNLAPMSVFPPLWLSWGTLTGQQVPLFNSTDSRQHPFPPVDIFLTTPCQPDNTIR